MARALIISPNADSRRILLRLLSTSHEYQETFAVADIASASSYLRSNQRLNVVFVAASFGEQNVAKFIESARESRACAECAYVVLLNPDERNTGAVSNHMMIGIHAFLSEPYAFDTIENAVKLAQAVRLQSSGDRMRAATGLLLAQILEGTPGGTEEIGSDAGKGNLWDRVQEGCRQYRELTGNSIGGTVIKEIGPLTPSKRLNEYKGISKRVKSMFESKLKEHLQTLTKRSRSG